MLRFVTAVKQGFKCDDTQLLLSYKGLNLVINIVSTVLQRIKLMTHAYYCLSRD